MGSFIIKQVSNGEYKFDLKADNGEIILSSDGYTNKAACLNGIESVRVNALRADRFQKRIDRNGGLFFILLASNGQILARSERYMSDWALEKAIVSVKMIAPNARLEA